MLFPLKKIHLVSSLQKNLHRESRWSARERRSKRCFLNRLFHHKGLFFSPLYLGPPGVPGCGAGKTLTGIAACCTLQGRAPRRAPDDARSSGPKMSRDHSPPFWPIHPRMSAPAKAPLFPRGLADLPLSRILRGACVGPDRGIGPDPCPFA